MAYHYFGIMETPPQQGERYDSFEPNAYHCEAVDDCYIEGILEALQQMDCYAHTLDCPVKGLVYCGITLIPPASIPILSQALTDAPIELQYLLHKAQKEHKFVIHFGI